MGSIDERLAKLDALPYRRLIKTHSPADCIPIFTGCRYLAVYRDDRDALVSWANHRRKMRPQVIETLNAAAAVDGVAPWPPTWDGNRDQLFDEWVDWGTPMEHLASWWSSRDEPLVLLVHFADLLADLDGEMRRISDFLSISVVRSRSTATLGQPLAGRPRSPDQRAHECPSRVRVRLL